MSTQAALYLAACLIVPPIWGWLVHKMFMRLGLERHLPAPTWSEPHPVRPVSEDLYYQI